MESAGALIMTSLTSHYAQSNLVMLFGKLGFSRVFFSRIKFPSEKGFEVFLWRKTGEPENCHGQCVENKYSELNENAE